MAYILVFPDQHSHDRAKQVLAGAGLQCETLETPRFCSELVVPPLRFSGARDAAVNELVSAGTAFSGVLPYKTFLKEVPEADPPDSRWRSMVGGLSIAAIGPSVTDPLKLGLEIIPERSLRPLIPIMARLIRGGAYRYEVPLLVFEEEHRLLSVSALEIVIDRADDLLDAWIMLRCMIELIITAWDNRLILQPETAARNGIGAIEIFKRLPGNNCGQCPYAGCMEFAMMLFRGQCHMEQCPPLLEESGASCRESLRWLLCAIGMMPEDSHQGRIMPPHGPGNERDRQPCGPGQHPAVGDPLQHR